MAAKKLDQLWDGWMTDLGRSYPKTLRLLEQDKTKEALAEYRSGCLASIKKLYSESAKTYPLRFAKAETWCVWTKKLYVLSMQVDKAIKAGKAKQAQTLLSEMRMHFYLLHQETRTFNSNDWIYAFHMEVYKDTTSTDALNEIVAQFKRAHPCLLAQNRDVATLYEQAKDAWLKTVQPLLETDSLSHADLSTMRGASDAFYKAYGVQFE